MASEFSLKPVQSRNEPSNEERTVGVANHRRRRWRSSKTGLGTFDLQFFDPALTASARKASNFNSTIHSALGTALTGLHFLGWRKPGSAFGAFRSNFWKRSFGTATVFSRSADRRLLAHGPRIVALTAMNKNQRRNAKMQHSFIPPTEPFTACGVGRSAGRSWPRSLLTCWCRRLSRRSRM